MKNFEEIIEILRETYDTACEETPANASPNIDTIKIQKAIVGTFSKEQLEWIEANYAINGEPYDLALYYLHGSRKTQRNEPLSTLLRHFADKKGGKVVISRAELRRRYPLQSYNDQKKILKAFLSASRSDIEWASRRLKNDWVPELSEIVAERWCQTHNPSLGKVVTAFLPVEFVLQEQEPLSESVGYEFVCARVGNHPDFVIDESRLTVPNLFYVKAKLGAKVTEDEMRPYLHRYLMSLHPDQFNAICVHDITMFSYLKGWDIMIWAMGQLGLRGLLLELLEFEAKVRKIVLELPKIGRSPSSRGHGVADFIRTIKKCADPDYPNDEFDDWKEKLEKLECFEDGFFPTPTDTPDIIPEDAYEDAGEIEPVESPFPEYNYQHMLDKNPELDKLKDLLYMEDEPRV